LVGGLKDASLKVAVSKALPLEQAGNAHRLLQARDCRARPGRHECPEQEAK
jgi:hypothetical protein